MTTLLALFLGTFSSLVGEGTALISMTVFVMLGGPYHISWIRDGYSGVVRDPGRAFVHC
jgi:hypothetical protein